MSNPISRSCTVLLLVLVGSGLGSPAVAQVLGSAFTYQGELTESEVPADGLYDLQICLFDSPISPTTMGCATGTDDVPIEGGLFSVTLDFGSAVFIGQERYLELRVRPGDSTAAFTVLSPRQLLRPAPEALRANVSSAAPWSGLSGMPAGFADGVDNNSGGTVTSVSAGAGLSGGPITGSGTLAIANGGVVNTMIASDAVDAARIVDDSVGAAEIAPNAVTASELANNAVDTAAIVDANVTRAKIAPAAIGAAQIDTTQVQTRIAGSCAGGEYFRGVQADGSLICELLPIAFNRLLDDAGDVGSHLSLALRANQRPVIAYHDQTLGNLKFYDCADPTCSTGTVRLIAAAGDQGELTAIAVRSNDRPVIAFRDVTNQSLRLIDCTNASCSTIATRILDDTINVGYSIAMALRSDDRPVVVYGDQSNFATKLYDCADSGCSSGTAIAISSGGPSYSLAINIRADNRPAFVMGSNVGSGTSARFYDCANAACSSGLLSLVAGTVADADVSMLLRADGRPLLGLSSIGSLSLFECTDADCSTGTTRTLVSSNAGREIDMAMRADLTPLFAFYGSTEGELRLYDCNTTCSTGGAVRNLDNNGDVGRYADLALRSDGRPVIAHYDITNSELKLHICANPDCS